MANADERYIQPYPPGPNGGGADLEEYRFNWNSPIHMSPSNPDVIYYGANVIFKTQDGGENWDIFFWEVRSSPIAYLCNGSTLNLSSEKLNKNLNLRLLGDFEAG